MQSRAFSLITIVAGLVFSAIGLGFFLASESRSVTALIPLFFGAPILICGLVALAKAEARKHAVHVALLFALLALVGSGMKIPGTIADEESSAMALASQVLLLLAAAGYLALGVRSFLNARRQRKVLAAAAMANAKQNPAAGSAA